jgi:hypothetical protein
VDIADALPILVPLVMLELLLVVLALWDLTRPERRVRGGSKLLWGVVVVFLGIIGPLVYFLAGREDS